MQAWSRLIGVVTALALTLTASTAMAGFKWWPFPHVTFEPAALQGPVIDEKIYPGTMCRPIGGQYWSDFNSTVFAFTNLANSGRGIVCPIVRDFTEMSTGPYHFAVEVVNATAGQSLRCSLYVMDGVGGMVSAGTVSTTAQGKQYLTSTRSQQAHRYSGEYTLACDLPARSAILNYKVHELVK